MTSGCSDETHRVLFSLPRTVAHRAEKGWMRCSLFICIDRGDRRLLLGDGVFPASGPGQQPQAILMRITSPPLNVALYDIETFYVCADSLAARGLDEKAPFVLDVTCLSSAALREQLSHYDTVLTF